MVYLQYPVPEMLSSVSSVYTDKFITLKRVLKLSVFLTRML